MFELSRVCSVFNMGNWDIHLIGWDNGNPSNRVVSFRDYYYFRADKVDVISRFSKQEFSNEPPMDTIDDFKAVKVNYTSIKEKKNLVELNEEYTYEADVLPEFKYLMSKGLKWSSFRHIVYFDIETTVNEDNDKANDPEKALCEVTAISCYSTLFDKYFTFTWHPEITADCSTPKIEEDGNKIKIFCRTEESVLCAFFEFIKEYNVDIISGWWSSGFDLPYIINRSIRLGLDDYRKLSPIGNVSCYKRGEDWKIYIDGLDHIDMLEAIKDLGYNLSNYKLATVAKEVLKNPDLEKLTHVTWRDWKDNYNGFMEYSIKDVEILMEISKTLQVFPLYVNIQQISNLTKLSLVLSKSFIVDHYILTEYFGKIVCPTRITKEKQKYMGATVLDPVAGLHENVAVMDFASLYPTTIMAFNLSPETFICSEESCLKMGKTIEEVIEKLNEKNIPFVDTRHDPDLFGGRYLFYAHSYKVGLLPQILRKMFISRKDIKKQMKNPALSEDEVTALDKKQTAYKLIMNSTYGAMGFNYFRLYTPEVADSITYFARKALLFGVKCFNHFNTESVLYGDSVVGSSLVKSRDGDISIESFWDNSDSPVLKFGEKEYKRSFGQLAYYDEKTSSAKFGSVYKLIRHKVEKKVYRITLECGKFVDVTEDHSIMVRDSCGNIVKKTPTQLSVLDVCIYLI